MASSDVKVSCRNCQFWEAGSILGTRGTCRRYPPTQIKSSFSLRPAWENLSWPKTMGGEWCGEFKGRPKD